jgi:hypothetical protein
MTVELESRVRRANLVSRDQHLERLYGDDLSHRLLRDVYSKKEGRMSEMTDRPEQVTVGEGDEGATVDLAPRRAPSRRSPALVPAVLTAVIAIGVIVALVARQPAPVVAQTPTQIAEAFMAALNEHDVDAAFALVGENAVLDGDAEDEMRGQIRMEELQGWTYRVEPCVEAPTPSGRSQVDCSYSHTSDLTRALGTGPYDENVYQFVIVDGEIISTNNLLPPTLFEETYVPFFQWVVENRPEAGDMFYHYSDEENLAKWEQYFPEWLATLEEAG